MPYFQNFPDEIEQNAESHHAISVNFRFPTEVQDDETPREAVERWIDKTDDDELVEFFLEKDWEYW